MLRKELGQQNKDEGLESVQSIYYILVDSVKEDNGFNPGVFDAPLPAANQVN